jgi:hypothetical protein
VRGFLLGIFTGLGVGAVDATRALLGPFGGSPALHVLCILGLIVPLVALAGLLTGALFERAARLGKSDGFMVGTAWSSFSARKGPIPGVPHGLRRISTMLMRVGCRG